MQPPNYFRPGSNGSPAPQPVYIPPALVDADDEAPTLQEIIDFFVKGRWIILGSFLGVLALAGLYTFLQDPVYESQGSMYVHAKNSGGVSLEEVLGVSGGERNISTEVEILKSRMMAERVGQQMIDQRYVPGTQELFPII
ncbi:MAG: Wzz/FepE/Etk N-terminal domain-containing protein, partial [Bacteroidota bacterium]